MKILPALFLLFITVNQTLAETDNSSNLQEYDVEIIIFEDAHARYINSEMWNQTNTEDTTSGILEKSQQGTKSTSFKTIKPAILKKDYQRIKNSSEYNILLYGAWRQAGLSDNEAFDINIADLENNNKSTSENSISGNLKLVLARYLHIYGQLNYQRKDGTAVTAGTSPADTQQINNVNRELVTENKPYPIDFHRRMRSKELHYIDHPLVGILIQINPVEKAKETTQ